jgi:hypothetical protein
MSAKNETSIKRGDKVPPNLRLPAAALHRAKMKGTLEKQSPSLMKSWQKRMCLLHEGILFYYKSPTDAEPAGTLMLSGAKVLASKEDPLIFSIEYDWRVFLWRCASAEERTVWVKALHSASQAKAKVLRVDPATRSSRTGSESSGIVVPAATAAKTADNTQQQQPAAQTQSQSNSSETSAAPVAAAVAVVPAAAQSTPANQGNEYEEDEYEEDDYVDEDEDEEDAEAKKAAEAQKREAAEKERLKKQQEKEEEEKRLAAERQKKEEEERIARECEERKKENDELKAASLARASQLGLSAMREGGTLLKYQSSGKGKPHERFFIMKNSDSLEWGAKRNKTSSAMAVSDMRFVVFGPYTSTFREQAKYITDRRCCVSVVAKDRTLDLEATSPEQAEIWYLGLQSVLQNRMREEGRPIYTRGQLAVRRTVFELRERALREGTSVGRIVAEAIRSAKKGKS